MSSTNAFASTRRAPRVTGLRNRFSAFRSVNTSVPKDVGGEGARLQVMHEDGTERVLGGQEREEEDDDVLLQADACMSASSSTSVGSEGREIVDDPALDAEAKVTGEDHQHLQPPPLRRSDSSKPVGSFPGLQEDGRERLRRSSGGVARTSPSSTGLLGIDISLIVALASPIGSLLTGSDHVKNVILIILLIYYLHQLVEVPWSLYRMSIPRHTVNNSEVLTELRTLEIFYLALTVLSPFLGSTLLRYVAKAVTGKKESLSWFSTSLFILATGIRPWSHLIERLRSRSEALNNILKDEHDKVMGKSAHREFGPGIDMEEELGRLRVHVHAIDNRLNDVADKNDDEFRDFSDHLDEIIDTLEIKFRRHRAELARGAQSQDSRMAALEAQVMVLTKVVRQGDVANAELKQRYMNALIFFHDLILFPWTVLRWSWRQSRRVMSPEVQQTVQYKRRLSRSHSSPSLRSSLASIPEEDQSTQYGADTMTEEMAYTFVPAKKNAPGVIMSVVHGMIRIFLSPLFVILHIASFLIGFPKPAFGGLFL